MLSFFVSALLSASCIQTMEVSFKVKTHTKNKSTDFTNAHEIQSRYDLPPLIEVIPFKKNKKLSKNNSSDSKNSDVTQSSSDLSPVHASSLNASPLNTSLNASPLISRSNSKDRLGGSEKRGRPMSSSGKSSLNQRRGRSLSTGTRSVIKHCSKLPTLREERKKQSLEKQEPIDTLNLEKQEQINALNNPLIFAVMEQNEACVEGLLKCKNAVEKNRTNLDGNTAWHCASFLESDEIFNQITDDPDVLMLANNKNQKPYHLTDVPERKLRLFAKESYNTCVEKHTVATLLNKKPEDIELIDIQKVKQALKPLQMHPLKNSKKNKQHSNILDETTRATILSNLELLQEDQFAYSILQCHNDNYTKRKLHEDRDIPESIQEQQTYINIDFIKRSVNAYITYYKQTK